MKPNSTIKEMKHQTASRKFMKKTPIVFDMSDPGTGKTYVQIMEFAERRTKRGGRAIVLAPKSLLKAAWGNDIEKFTPKLTYSIAWAKNRKEALSCPADIVITNIDAVKDILKMPKGFWKDFDTIIIDESTAFKHHTSHRSRATAKLVKNFKHRSCMSGTPTSNGICDIWHQVFLLDDGKRLGKSFFGFRNAACVPKQVGPSANMVQWVDRDGIENAVIGLIADITIRNRFEECIDIPANHQYPVTTVLAPKHKKFYDKLEEDSLAEIANTSVTAINGAVLATKLLQAASGAVYNDEGSYSLINTDRYKLVLDLIEARDHTVCFYLWDHQREELIKEAKSRKIKYIVWNPNHPEIADDFQAGKYQVLFAHPASAGHGLTFTTACATIWPSPTYNLEWFIQGMKRVYRNTQKRKTENIVVLAEGTIDEKVWPQMQAKKIRMDSLFEALKEAA